MINISDKFTAKTMDGIVADSHQIQYEQGKTTQRGDTVADKITELDTQINGEEARVIDDFSQLTLTNAAIINNWSTYGGATSWLIEVEPRTNISIDTTGATNTCFLSFLKTNDVVIGQAPNIINGFETLVTSLRTEKGIPLSLVSTRCAMGKDDVLNMVAPADMNYLYVQNLASDENSNAPEFQDVNVNTEAN